MEPRRKIENQNSHSSTLRVSVTYGPLNPRTSTLAGGGTCNKAAVAGRDSAPSEVAAAEVTLWIPMGRPKCTRVGPPASAFFAKLFPSRIGGKTADRIFQQARKTVSTKQPLASTLCTWDSCARFEHNRHTHRMEMSTKNNHAIIFWGRS